MTEPNSPDPAPTEPDWVRRKRERDAGRDPNRDAKRPGLGRMPVKAEVDPTEPGFQPPAPPDPDPTRLMRFVAKHAFHGVLAGWACLLAFLWLDLGGLGALVHGSPSRELISAMLAGAFGITFGLVGIVWGVLVVLPHED